MAEKFASGNDFRHLALHRNSDLTNDSNPTSSHYRYKIGKHKRELGWTMQMSELQYNLYKKIVKMQIRHGR